VKKKITIKDIVILQLVVIIYSTANIIAKIAAGSIGIWFFLCFGLEFVVLAIYAVLWQQMIKKFDLSIAYANRAMEIFWSLVWAVLLFHNQITIPKLVGVVLVVIGIFIINSDQKDGEEEIHV
jgi:drug/metabolite transporter (DMT)-like permease